jgi:trans-2-enoyl-CoA reductase
MSIPTGKPTPSNDEAQRFIETLKENGQLSEITSDAAIAGLEPKITHVRYPDGTVKRIRFTGQGSR